MVTYSQGSVTKSNGRWMGQIWGTDENGKRSHKSKILKEPDGSDIPCDKSSNRGRNHAIGALNRWRAELIAESDKETEEDERAATLAGVNLADYLDEFLKGLEDSQHVEKSTLASYRASAKKVKASLGSVEVTRLTTAQVQAWEVELLKSDGLSPRSVTKHHRLLSQALKAAVDRGQLMANPCDGVKLPKKHKEQPHAMTKAKADELLGTLAAMPQNRVVTAARIALTSGLRVGEVCALQWRDVDEAEGVLHVTKAIGVGEGGAYVKGTKNSYSTRDVPITPQLADALKARRQEVVREALKLDVMPVAGKLSECYIIGRMDGRPVTPNIVSREWGQLRSLLDLTDAKGHPLKFHDLRHTWATVAVQSGADIKSVSAIMGHADASMTLNIYASSDADARRVAADKIAQFMGETPRHGEVRRFGMTGTEQ